MMGARGFAGRRAERVRVAAVLRGQADAAGLVVSGEAGCGKSRLIGVATEDARQDGVTVLTGWCLRLSESLPLLPVLDILRALDAADEGQLLKHALSSCPPFVREEIEQLLQPSVVALGDRAGSGSSSARYRVFEAIAQVFTVAGRFTSVAVIVEDLHWADAMTLDLLEFLLSPGRANVPPIVVSFRTGEPDRNLAREWWQRLLHADRVQQCPLPLLTPAETGEQIAFLLGATPPAAVVTAVFNRTDGNPFFTGQLLAHNHATVATPSPPDLAVSHDLAELMVARAGELTDSELGIVQALAVAARPLTDQELASAGGMAGEQVQIALASLTERLLISTSDGGDHQLAHAVIGEALYATLLPGRRRQLHHAIANTLASRQAGTLDGEIAGHLRAAGDTDAELAVRIRAARHADEVGAAVEAEHHWSRALDLARSSARPTLPDDIALSAIYGHAEDALWVIGQSKEGGALAEEAYRDLFQETLPVMEQADLLFRVGHARWNLERRDGLQLTLRALTLYETLSPSPGLVRTLRDLEAQSRQRGDYPAARRYAARGLQLATDLGLREERIRFLGQKAWIAMSVGDDDEAIRLVKSQQADFSAGDSPRVRVAAAVVQTDILLKLGHFDHVYDAAASGLAAGSHAGLQDSFGCALLRWNFVDAATQQGRPDIAAALTDQMTRTTQVELNHQLDHAASATMDMFRGRLAEAQERWHNVFLLDTLNLDFRLEYASRYVELRLWTGDPAAGLAHATDLLLEAGDTDESRVCGPLLTLAARACADLSDNARARPTDPSLRAHAQDALDTVVGLHARMRTDPLGAGSLTRTGDGDHATWLAEIGRFHNDHNPSAWAAAAIAWQTLGRPHREAYALFRQADTLLNRRDRANAEPVLRAAAAAAAGHTPLLTEITALAHRARIDLPTNPEPTPPIQPSTDGSPEHYQLTARELTVLHLVANGRTNIEIGRELFMSPKTASVHVSNILRKLHATSRTHAATIAHRAGLLTDIKRDKINN